MITRKQLEMRYSSFLSKRDHFLSKLRRAKDSDKYDKLVLKLNDVDNILRLYEWMLSKEEYNK